MKFVADETNSGRVQVAEALWEALRRQTLNFGAQPGTELAVANSCPWQHQATGKQMSTSETLEALEEGLITEEEAVEQAMVDDVDALYEQAAAERIDTIAAGMRQAARTTLVIHR